MKRGAIVAVSIRTCGIVRVFKFSILRCRMDRFVDCCCRHGIGALVHGVSWAFDISKQSGNPASRQPEILMRTIQVSELTGQPLIFAVCKLERPNTSPSDLLKQVARTHCQHSSLIRAAEIARDQHINVMLRKLGTPAERDKKWHARADRDLANEAAGHFGPTYDVAVMRAHVGACCGDSVEVPEELFNVP